MKRLTIFLVLGVLMGVGFAGCAEREQTALYAGGKYRGKSDTRPWDNASPAAGSAQWIKGDRATWENEIRERSGAQGESRRIGH